MSAALTDKSKPYIPLAGGATDGWSNDEEATATCFCGAVQLKFATNTTHSQPRALASSGTFICNCADCHKITASMFASNFAILDTHLTHVRGRENLTEFSQSRTVASGNTMTNYFCSTCGTLMYRISAGFPGISTLRIGTVDDFHLHETKLKPQVEQFVEKRVSWLHGAEGVKQVEGSSF
ncbi:putative glutathione-dependent formaldehyde-activating gfa [Mycena sanguinolenta]|uniref:Putative glutathione-dependent formaldehyde-activating gfa n=1 Tax=Mycena sanguinolenta TaxID=230812 RepID=A0A8H6Z261_9AGAR|nr:putative glutathione-dependent formaldehyde-activating gfa [Mycena sanguinolenta]